MIHIALISAILLVTLVCGFTLAFSIVIMPGLSELDDRDYLRAFQVIDGMIQKNQPIFMLVWIGSFLSVLALSVMAFLNMESQLKWLILVGSLIFILGVHVPTVIKNIPLNNRLQEVELQSANVAVVETLKNEFSAVWIPWNHRRTIAALVSAMVYLLVIIKIE
jgi:uncharacterized membrane protein